MEVKIGLHRELSSLQSRDQVATQTLPGRLRGTQVDHGVGHLLQSVILEPSAANGGTVGAQTSSTTATAERIHPRHRFPE